MTCNKCGAANPENSKFCSICGQPITIPSASPAPDGSSPGSAQNTAACPRCGTDNPSDGLFCQKCGLQLANAPSPSPATEQGLESNPGFNPNPDFSLNPAMPAGSYQNNMAAPGSDKKKVFIAAGIAGALVLIVLAIVISIFASGRSLEKTVDNLVNGLLKPDAEKLISILPNEYIEECCEDEEISKRELIEQCQQILETAADFYNMEFGDGWKYKFRILSDFRVEDYKLEDIRSDYLDDYGIWVKDADSVYVELTIISDGKYESDEIEFIFVKIGNSWYIDPDSMDSFW